MSEKILNITITSWQWLKITMFLLGLVYCYQFAKVNFFDGSISYSTGVIAPLESKSKTSRG